MRVIVHQAGSALDISSAYSIYGIGSINDHVNCQGTLAATTGYSINLNGGLNISGTGSVNLGTGTLYVNDTISGMSGGSLNASYQYVGSTGTGTFTQTGGTNNATYIIIGTTGMYTLNSGTLNINGSFENQGTWDLSNSSAVINMSSSIVILSGTILATAENSTLNIDAHSLLIVPSGHGAYGLFRKHQQLGHYPPGWFNLDISSAYSIYGIGSINDHVNCQGTLGLITVTSPSPVTYLFHHLNGGLNISGTGSVNLGNGTIIL